MAIKLECVKTKHPQLHIESKFYKMMQGGGEIGREKMGPGEWLKEGVILEGLRKKMIWLLHRTFSAGIAAVFLCSVA